MDELLQAAGWELDVVAQAGSRGNGRYMIGSAICKEGTEGRFAIITIGAITVGL